MQTINMQISKQIAVHDSHKAYKTFEIVKSIQ